MKTTKQTVISILILFMAFSACKKDDMEDQDPIIGKWGLEQQYVDGVSEDISDCQKQSVFEFLKTEHTKTQKRQTLPVCVRLILPTREPRKIQKK